jgi:hypothetical protein
MLIFGITGPRTGSLAGLNLRRAGEKTNTMEQNPPWQANVLSYSKNSPRITEAER